jgi:hypothetical protein
VLVNADGVLAYDGEVLKTASKERVGYRFLATRGYADGWETRDNGSTVGLLFDGFAQGMGKPEWDWFGDQVKVRAVLVGLRREEFKKERRPLLRRFITEPSEATFSTKELEVGD